MTTPFNNRAMTTFPAYPGMPVATHPNAPRACFTDRKDSLTASGHSTHFDTAYLVMGLLTVRVEGSIAGTNPTLAILYQGKDTLARWCTLARLVVSEITPEPLSMLVVGCTNLGRIAWEVGGITPNFTEVGISLQMR